MSRCEEYQELISRMLDGELTTRQRLSLEEHIRNCPDCAALYRAFSALSRQIGGDLEEVPLDLRENVMAEIRRENIRRKNRIPRGVLGVLAAAACIAVIVGVSLGVSPRLGGQISAAAYSSTAQKSAAAEEPKEAVRGFDDALEEEACVTEEMEAPQAEEPFAPEPAMPEAACDAAVNAADKAEAPEADAGENGGTEEYDLSDWMDLQLLRDLLDGEEAVLDREELGEEPAFRLRLKDGEISVFLKDEALYYVDPADDSVMRAQLSPEEFRAFLES